MRILQLIDTLHPGGAERMAVNYANALYEAGHSSFLAVTREEGIFKDLLNNDVGYLFLNKRNTLDVIALKKLSKYIQEKQIDLVHAHSSSWFFGVLSKMLDKRIKLIWHDHYGRSDFLEDRGIFPLQYLSQKFDGIISVNRRLKLWAAAKLRCKEVIFLNNFIEIPEESENYYTEKEKVELVCLANFREQKDHITLIKVCDRLSKSYNFKLNLIGKNFNNGYSRKLEKAIKERDYIEYHGEVNEPSKILSNMHIGILSSKSEGLPLAILEYAANGLAVVCTEVGQNKEVVGKYAAMVPPENVEELEAAILEYMYDAVKMKNDSLALKNEIIKKYSKQAVIQDYTKFIENL